jgi:2-(3-amino-3-carboxypropyl)histidine synthase
MRILIQFPEGLKKYACDIAKKMEERGDEVYLSASPCYGACDLAIEEAKAIKADKIIHIGHNKFIKHDIDIDVEYLPFPIDFPISIIKEGAKILMKEGIKSISLVTTVQHIHQINEMKEVLEKEGLSVYLKNGFWAREKGQILGCDPLAAYEKNADAILFVGDGLFHPLGIRAEKRIFMIDREGIKEITALIKKKEKQRKASLIKAYSSHVFGILVSTKIGQYNMEGAKWAKKALLSYGKEAHILVSNEINPSSLYNFMSFDCYVNTACPRIIDDVEAFGKPIIDLSMLKALIKMWAAKEKSKI